MFKKFVGKSAAFVLILAIAVGICDLGWIRGDSQGTNRFRHVPEKIEICNIGASHSRWGFNYEDYENQYTTFNFALDSQPLFYDAAILETYRDRLKPGCIVFIIVSFPMLAGEDASERESFESLNQRYYSFLPPEAIRKYDWKTAMRLKFIPFTQSNTARGVLSGLLFGADNSIWEHTMSEAEMVADADAAYGRHITQNREGQTEEGAIIYNQEALDSVYRMITLCREEEAIPVLLTTPFTDKYVERVRTGAPDYYERFYEIMAQISAETGAPYYNYSEDERFLKQYDKFMNGDHLNKGGAREFTRIVMEEIVEPIREGNHS